ncbi:MAG: adenylate kinase [Chloroflexi bacterium]|nr:adenylate kinase [Chloroflexota bacterium]
MFVILLGPPGAGKGTQARLLAESLGVPRISTGDLFREEMASGSALGRSVAAYMDAGQFVPDETTIALLQRRLRAADARDGHVLDGFPRTVRQAEELDRILARRGQHLDRVIDLNVDTEALVERLAGRSMCPSCQTTYHDRIAPPRRQGLCDRCGATLVRRVDDQPETVRTRLRMYHENTEPLITYYDEAGVLSIIDGGQPPEGVTRDMFAALGMTKGSF